VAITNSSEKSVRQIISEEHNKLAIKRRKTIRREEYLDYMTFTANKRPLFIEIFGPLVGLREEWEAQGASAAELDFSAFTFRHHGTYGIPAHTGCFGGQEPVIIENTDEVLIYTDHLGRRMRMPKGKATLALPMDNPVKTMDDWLRIKPLYEFHEGRLPQGDWLNEAQKHKDDGDVITIGIPGGFDEPRQLLGEEQVAMCAYTQPDLIHDILETIGTTAYKVIEYITARFPIDELCVHEDMAGKSGPLWGPTQVDQFMKPYYRKIWDLVQERGARTFFIDSDGDCNAILQNLIDAGITIFSPCEPQAAMDIVKMREQYGTQLAFMGGINKHVLRQSKEAIVQELEYKVPPLIQTGGCIFGLDHRIPNGTPLEHYRFYVQHMWELIKREAS
jgi:hypothetical protein